MKMTNQCEEVKRMRGYVCDLEGCEEVENLVGLNRHGDAVRLLKLQSRNYPVGSGRYRELRAEMARVLNDQLKRQRGNGTTERHVSNLRKGVMRHSKMGGIMYPWLEEDMELEMLEQDTHGRELPWDAAPNGTGNRDKRHWYLG
jgi:hypothetical protein